MFKKTKYQANVSERILGRRERRLLAETAQIEEELLPSFVRPLLVAVATLVVLFLAWAGLTHLTEVARAPGEIIPSGQVKVVQHLDGGVVKEIAVEEHALVQQGQVLLRIDGAPVLTDLRQTEAHMIALRLRAERLEAFAEDRTPNFEALAGKHADLLADQQKIYRTQMAAKASTLSILDMQAEQRTNRSHQSRQSLAAAQEHQALTKELSGMREDLASRRLINRTVLLETRRAKVTADGEVARLTDEINVAGHELAEVRNRRIDTINQLRRDALAEMGVVRAELAEVEESYGRLQARESRLEVRAPNRGYVQDMKVQTVGQVVQPGALLMQIVPDDAPLEAMIRISPKEIGYVKIGQPVNLRVSSFDFTRFGVAKGTVKRITATSVTGDDGRPYYRGWVSLPQPYVGSIPGRYPLQTGMAVDAEILTGEKTLLAYLAKPVFSVLSQSFQER